MDFEDIRWRQALELVHQGNRAEAMRVCESLIVANPSHVPGLRLLATIQLQTREISGVIQTLTRLSELCPEDSEIWFNLGSAYAHRNELAMALRCFDSATRLSPQNPDCHFGRALALRKLNRLEESVRALDTAISMRPTQIELYLNAGDILLELGNCQKALSYYQRAAQLDPKSPIPVQNIGWTYHFLGDLDLSLEYCRKAVELDPNSEQSHIFLGNALNDLRRLPEAMQCYEKAIEINPHSAVAHSNLGKLLLRIGDFKRGWQENEWRMPLVGMTAQENRFSQPVWDGSNPAGKTILLYGEQGLGDQIQFFRYCRNVRELGAKVVLQANPRLHRLLRSSSGFFDTLIGKETIQDFDYQASLMSLPGILGTSLETIPRYESYLSAELDLIKSWRQRIGISREIKIGILWQGNPNYLGDRFRSIPLQYFEKVTGIENTRWINLQTSDVAKQLSQFAFAKRIEDYSQLADVGPDAFIDTAAIIKNLDLVITCDSSIGHLAGALGAKTWLLISNDAEWRWFLDRSDSPWYPSVRLFRQNKLGDWSTVFEQVQKELTSMCKRQTNNSQ